MTTAVKVPRCYGLLFVKSCKDCQQCLVNDQCKLAMKRPRGHQAVEFSDGEVPNDKPSIILLICDKYDIPTRYKPRGAADEIDITEENKTEFHNIDFLLTSKQALKKLLLAKCGG